MYVLAIFFIWCVSLPLQLFIGIFIVCFSGFPVLFRQKRIGKDGKPFVMYKFRTMAVGAENQQKRLRKQNEADGPVFKIHNDPRFSPIGKFLSHTGLDELPQLWNVLRGDMALIGPRPLPKEEANKLTRWQQKRQSIKPGIISPWILEGYHSKPFDAWMNSDVLYTRQKSFLYDMKICLQMIPYIFSLIEHEIFR